MLLSPADTYSPFTKIPLDNYQPIRVLKPGNSLAPTSAMIKNPTPTHLIYHYIRHTEGPSSSVKESLFAFIYGTWSFGGPCNLGIALPNILVSTEVSSSIYSYLTPEFQKPASFLSWTLEMPNDWK